MEENTKFSCCISNSDPATPLGMTVWLDDQQVWTSDHITESTTVEFSLPDDEDQSHEIRFCMTGKTSAHTKIDDQGRIVKDAVLTIDRVFFDEIEIPQLTMTEHSVYRHDFNGHQSWVDDKFYGSMGCNGVLTFKFTTPIYLWLLEHT